MGVICRFSQEFPKHFQSTASGVTKSNKDLSGINEQWKSQKTNSHCWAEVVNPNQGCNEVGSEVREERDQGEVAKQNKTKQKNLLNSSQNQRLKRLKAKVREKSNQSFYMLSIY